MFKYTLLIPALVLSLQVFSMETTTTSDSDSSSSVDTSSISSTDYITTGRD
jgi:hypothetical protein